MCATGIARWAIKDRDKRHRRMEVVAVSARCNGIGSRRRFRCNSMSKGRYLRRYSRFLPSIGRMLVPKPSACCSLDHKRR